jgi:Carboxypeptidase regulatory-like domain/TonB dependent receptor-like, beta-barrel
MSSRGTIAFRLIFFILLLAFGLKAAGQTANLSGTVSDSSQAAVVGASISISRESTAAKLTTTSTERGTYRFAFLLPGSYTIRVEAQGFETISRAGVKLDPGQARLDFALSPAVVKEDITVHGRTSSLQTESPAVSTEIDPQLVRDLPLNGRTFQSLIFLAPGVVATSCNLGCSGGQFSVNGQRDTSNYFTVDGVSANVGVGPGPAAGGAVPAFNYLGQTHNMVSMDDMQEFKLQTSTYSAAYGRAAGGQLEIVTHSGSNQYHGSLFDYFRNEAMDANDWFTNAAGLPRAPRRQNDFGGVFGGPILKDRTFFFASYEGLRVRRPVSIRMWVPSRSVRQAATGVSQQILNAFPLPKGPEDPATMLAPLVGSSAFLDSSDNTSIRIDHTLNQKLVVFGRYSEAFSNQRFQRPGGFDRNEVNFRSVTLGATRALSPEMASDLRVNYSRTTFGSNSGLDSSGGAIPPPDSLLFPAPFASPGSSLVSMSVQGTRAFFVGRFADYLQRQGNLVSNTSIVHETHEVRFGIDYRYLAPLIGPTGYRQNIRFAGVPGVLSGLATNPSINSADSVTLSFHNLSLYGQDNWKVSPRLTLIYGLRWEFEPPPHAQANQSLRTVTGFPDLASMQLAPAGTPLYQTTYTNFAPRVGLAYQLRRSPGRETVVRGGFGTYYDLGIGSIADAASSFPHKRNKSIPGSVPYPLSPQDAAPPPPVTLDPPYSSIRLNVFVPDHVLPRSHQWNLTVDQTLGTNQVISASYVGEAGRQLLQQNTLFDPSPVFVNDSQINLTTNASRSDYQALQVQVQRRMSRGLSALLSYTWSHSTDDVSTELAFDYLPDPRVDHGASDFDVRHAFNAAFTCEIPARKWKPVVDAILKGWSMDGIFAAKTALPVNVIMERGDSGFTEAILPARPDSVPGAPLYLRDPILPGGRRINPAAFSVPLQARQGNLPRNALRGFATSQLDFDVRRNFSITERIKLQLRADFFNVFNHPNFVNVDGYLGFLDPPLDAYPTFGLAGPPDGGPRSIQLSLRLRF